MYTKAIIVFTILESTSYPFSLYLCSLYIYNIDHMIEVPKQTNILHNLYHTTKNIGKL